MSTFGWRHVALVLLFTVLFLWLPTTRWFDQGRLLYLRTPNPYLPVYSLPGVERWLPVEMERSDRLTVLKETKS